MSLPLKLAWGSVALGILVLGLKFAAYWLTGSIALYSDALESIINVVTGMVAVLSIRWSMKPPDPGHPYGHHKAEYLSAVFEGVLIVIAALSILHEAYVGFLQPKPLDAPVQGLLVNGLASAINAVWCWVLIRQGRRHRSPALVADGRHLLTDVITSGGGLVRRGPRRGRSRGGHGLGGARSGARRLGGAQHSLVRLGPDERVGGRPHGRG